MACYFTVSVEQPIASLIEKAREGITSNGGTFEGDVQRGTYSIPVPTGTIRGNYTVTDKQIAFEITAKPAIPTCKRIEKELRDYLSSPDPERLSFE